MYAFPTRNLFDGSQRLRQLSNYFNLDATVKPCRLFRRAPVSLHGESMAIDIQSFEDMLEAGVLLHPWPLGLLYQPPTTQCCHHPNNDKSSCAKLVAVVDRHIGFLAQRMLHASLWCAGIPWLAWFTGYSTDSIELQRDGTYMGKGHNKIPYLPKHCVSLKSCVYRTVSGKNQILGPSQTYR